MIFDFDFFDLGFVEMEVDMLIFEYFDLLILCYLSRSIQFNSYPELDRHPLISHFFIFHCFLTSFYQFTGQWNSERNLYGGHGASETNPVLNWNCASNGLAGIIESSDVILPFTMAMMMQSQKEGKV